MVLPGLRKSLCELEIQHLVRMPTGHHNFVDLTRQLNTDEYRQAGNVSGFVINHVPSTRDRHSGSRVIVRLSRLDLNAETSTREN